MRRSAFIVCFLMILVCGCSNNSPVVPPENELTVVGDYTYSQRSGAVETGTLVLDNQHRIRLVPDRSSASSFSNEWFSIQCDYRNFDYLDDGLPVYHPGDDVLIDIDINYKQDLPLNRAPFLFARGYIQHRNARDWSPLPGNSIQSTNLLLAPYGHLKLRCGYRIPLGMPQEYPYTRILPLLAIDLIYKGGVFSMNLISGNAGIWLLGPD